MAATATAASIHRLASPVSASSGGRGRVEGVLVAGVVGSVGTPLSDVEGVGVWGGVGVGVSAGGVELGLGVWV